jgi:hypothetical protein
MNSITSTTLSKLFLRAAVTLLVVVLFGVLGVALYNIPIPNPPEKKYLDPGYAVPIAVVGWSICITIGIGFIYGVVRELGKWMWLRTLGWLVVLPALTAVVAASVSGEWNTIVGAAGLLVAAVIVLLLCDWRPFAPRLRLEGVPAIPPERLAQMRKEDEELAVLRDGPKSIPGGGLGD